MPAVRVPTTGARLASCRAAARTSAELAEISIDEDDQWLRRRNASRSDDVVRHRPISSALTKDDIPRVEEQPSRIDHSVEIAAGIATEIEDEIDGARIVGFIGGSEQFIDAAVDEFGQSDQRMASTWNHRPRHRCPGRSTLDGCRIREVRPDLHA